MPRKQRQSSSTLIGIVSALSRETRYIRRDIQIARTIIHEGVELFEGRFGETEVVLFSCGSGLGGSARFNRIIDRYPFSLILSLGYGGALREGLEPGKLIVCRRMYRLNGDSDTDSASTEHATEYSTEYSTASSAECQSPSLTVPADIGAGVTTESIAGAERKMELGRRIEGSLVVDMEGYQIVTRAKERGIPTVVLRAIVDRVDEDLGYTKSLVDLQPNLSGFVQAAIVVLAKPARLKQLIRLASASRRASRALSTAAKSFLSNPSNGASRSQSGGLLTQQKPEPIS